ncbi:MAG: endonuclease Q family protein [Candidatus Bathyarchaeia archaeon]
MRVIADLHLHSRYSRATSEEMNIREITRFARLKGLNLVGTGDFTHPQWLKELHEGLVEIPETSLYKPAGDLESPVCYMVTSEVSTIFTFNGKVRKIHHVVLTPSLETAVQINDRLAKYGDLAVDGRPILDMTAPQLVEEIMEVSGENVVIPSHAWTPWFSLFGAFSGFDRMEDCYQDMTHHIPALETGLSSDPPMNWRLSSLDKYALVSNSDSHSPWPWRMGREANVFELERFTYGEVVNALRKRDLKRFLFTIETDPAYGKYHWTGHRDCQISLPPQEAIKLGNRCPVCHRVLTKGVEQRVEELADRPVGFKPEGAIGFVHLLPLSEIISTVMGVTSPATKDVWDVYNALVKRFGNEYSVLLDAPREEMAKIVDPRIAEAVVRVREEQVKVIPGYDGVYGQLVILEGEEKREAEKKLRGEIRQRSITDFM